MSLIKTYYPCTDSNKYYVITNKNLGITLTKDELLELMILDNSLNNFTR